VTPAVVLLPPLGHGAAIYDALAARLAPDLQVTGLDYPLADLDLGAEDLVAHLADRMTAAVAARAPALIGGISLGATLCYLLASRVGARGLILMAPGGPRVPVTRREGVLATMAELGEAEFARRHLGVAGGGVQARASCALLRAALAADLAAEMARLTVGVDLVWGADDRLFNARHMEKVRRLLPPHRYHVLPGVGHYAAAEAPDRVAGIIRAALEPT
jgi:pimeloyl-ACP methyl ester carboxylesterase